MGFDSKLISKVKANDTLYDVKSKFYRKSNERENIWSEISKEMGMPIDFCKQRWKGIRDRFVKETKKYGSESSTWKHYHSLDFLLDNIRPRDRNSIFSNREKDFKHDTEFLNFENLLNDKEIISSTAEQIIDDQSNTESIQTSRKKIKLDNDDKNVFTGIDDIGGMTKYPTEPESENSYFFKMISIKMEKLPASIQDELQMKILCMVNNELKENRK